MIINTISRIELSVPRFTRSNCRNCKSEFRNPMKISFIPLYSSSKNIYTTSLKENSLLFSRGIRIPRDTKKTTATCEEPRIKWNLNPYSLSRAQFFIRLHNNHKDELITLLLVYYIQSSTFVHR